MRLGFVSLMEDAPWGGSEHLWAATAEAALRAGHDVSVSVPAWDETPAPVAHLAELGATVSPRSPAVTPELLRRAGDKRFGLVSMAPRRLAAVRRRAQRGRMLRRFVAAARPDVVCLSQGAVPLVGLPEVHAVLSSLPCPLVVLTNGADDRDDFDGETRARVRAVVRQAVAVGFPSASVRRCLERQAAVELPHAFEFRYPNRFAGRPALAWPPDGGPARFAYVGRVSVAKGVDGLFQALAGDGAPPFPYRLDLYGEVHGGDHFERLADLLGLSDRVRFHGFTDDLAGVWADHHLLLFPSRMEGAPIAVAEAMLAGRPVVATAVGGIPEWLDDGVTGFLAPSPEPAHLATAMRAAWCARDRWREMGRAAHDAASSLVRLDAADDLLARLEAAGEAPR